MRHRCLVQKKVKYQNKRLAEKAMLSFYEEDGADTFGSYRCPFCYYWHITSQYDNRSKQSKHEFRMMEKRREKNRKNKQDKKKTETLPQKQMQEALKKLCNEPYKRWWHFWK